MNETCEFCGSEMTLFQGDGRHWFKCGSIKRLERGTPCFVHQIKLLNERIGRLIDVGFALSEELDEKTPSPNCSCHISPPCWDCTNHAGAREAMENWNRLNP
jgi:hypothetical protein